MLTDSELVDMRAVQAETMTQVATITSMAYASDGAGGTTVTETTAEAACRLAPLKNMPVATILAGKLAERMPWRCTFATGTDVQEDDRITVEGRAFEVVGILGPYGFETALACILAERD